MVEVIERGEPAIIVCHWTGIYFHGQELGFKTFQEVVRRLHTRFDHLHWMKLSEIARYWAAKELTRIELRDQTIRFHAPYASPHFTIRAPAPNTTVPTFIYRDETLALNRVSSPANLQTNTWIQDRDPRDHDH